MTIETYDDEALLDRFREWLRAARDEAAAIPEESTHVEPDPDSGIGLYRLVEEFTALRQEVKLETKGSRGLQEQVEALLPTVRQAVDQIRSIVPREDQAVQSAARPLAEAMADLDESLDRGRLEIIKARDRLIGSRTGLVEELDALRARQPWYRRAWLSSYHEAARKLVEGQSEETATELFDALLEGYGLIQARLRRAMEAGQVGRIECLGLPVDPSRMSVVEAVESTDQPPGYVVDEVRRGYTWRGRVLRYAEVRAARSRIEIEATSETEEDRDEANDRESD